MSFSDAPVIRVDLMQCRVPLPAPVTLGPVEIRFRDYVSMRLVFADGSEGHATGFERGMPLFDIAARMAPLCLGRGSGQRIAVRDTQLTPAPASRPVHLRGISLCNIAFWDAFCRQVGRPLWAVLGGARDRVPLMPVIGYGATPERVAAQAADLADRGFRIIKLMIDGTDFATDRALIAALAGALPDGVSFGIDGHWSWRTPAQALPTCRLAQDHGAVFVEDPFTPSQWRAIAQLQEKIDVPLAVGEDVIDRHGFRDLAEVAPILRPDASASGGIDGLMEAVTLAATHDRSVIPHVFPALHAHAGFANRVVTCVESILPEIGADPIDRFFAHAPRVEGGDLLADGVPGAGTALRWDDLAALATRTQTFS